MDRRASSNAGCWLLAEVDHRAETDAVGHVDEGGGDLGERSGCRHHTLEVEAAGTPEREQPRELEVRVRRAEEGAGQALLRQCPGEHRELDAVLEPWDTDDR